MEVFPAFALPTMSTLNWIFGTRGEPDGVDGTEAGAEVDVGAEARDRAGDCGEGAGAAAGVCAGAGDKAGDDAGTGEGDGTGQQALCFTPIARRCCEK